MKELLELLFSSFAYAVPPSPRPEFEVTCPELRSPAYGRLRISSLRPGGTAVLECDGGFDEATLTCQQDGRWSGSISNCPPPGKVQLE